MRVLVTGATGMIGSAVCDALLTRGDEVVGLSREIGLARETNPTVTWHRWDPELERPPAAALEGVDGVINLVGEPIQQRWSAAAKRRILGSRERATKNLVDELSGLKARPAVLVSQSAVGYYGDRGDALVDESVAPGSSFDAGVCVAWEAAARQAEAADVRVAITRSGLVLDPAGGLLKRLLPPFRMGAGGPVAGGHQYMAWIHRDDEVAVLLWALDSSDAVGVYNSTAPNPVTNREFAKTLGKVLHRPAVTPAPKLALRAMFGAELAEVAAGGQRVVPRRALDQGFEFRFAELEPALRDLLAA